MVYLWHTKISATIVATNMGHLWCQFYVTMDYSVRHRFPYDADLVGTPSVNKRIFSFVAQLVLEICGA
jgi:hypothetical protein